MANQSSAGRLLVVGAFAIAAALGPPLAAFTATSTVAAPGCTQTQTGGSSSMVCTPGMTGSGGGAPSEQDITNKNASRRSGGLLGGLL